MALNVQYMTLVAMTLCGITLGTVYDMYRVIVKHWRFFRWMVPLLDLAYWIFALVLVLWGLMWANDGEIRFYIFVLMFFGWLLYKMLFQKAVVASTVATVVLIKHVAFAIYRMIDLMVFRPVRLLWKGFQAILKAVDRVLQMIEGLIVKPIRPAYRLSHRLGRKAYRPIDLYVKKGKRKWKGIWLSVAKWLTDRHGDDPKP